MIYYPTNRLVFCLLCVLAGCIPSNNEPIISDEKRLEILKSEADHGDERALNLVSRHYEFSLNSRSSQDQIAEGELWLRRYAETGSQEGATRYAYYLLLSASECEEAARWFERIPSITVQKRADWNKMIDHCRNRQLDEDDARPHRRIETS